ncbi:hypothetical protein ACOMHN_066950 [Nucella lapillus]
MPKLPPIPSTTTTRHSFVSQFLAFPSRCVGDVRCPVSGEAAEAVHNFPSAADLLNFHQNRSVLDADSLSGVKNIIPEAMWAVCVGRVPALVVTVALIHVALSHMPQSFTELSAVVTVLSHPPDW